MGDGGGQIVNDGIGLLPDQGRVLSSVGQVCPQAEHLVNQGRTSSGVLVPSWVQRATRSAHASYAATMALVAGPWSGSASRSAACSSPVPHAKYSIKELCRASLTYSSPCAARSSTTAQ